METASTPRFLIPLLILVFTYIIIVFTIDACYGSRSAAVSMVEPGCRMCDGNMFEEFTNELSTYTQSQTLAQYRSDMTPPTTADNAPSHLMAGTATKNIVRKDDKTEALIEIAGNMYILNGNVYTDKEMARKQAYSAFLVNSIGERLYLGDLRRGQDGEHRLRVKTSNLDQLTGYDRIMVVYKSNGDDFVILNGKF
jgi:hypothetical protein